jgi:hypothetical protein
MGDFNRNEHYTRWAVGIIRAYVVSEKMDPATIAKILASGIGRGLITSLDLRRSLDEVESVSVQDFELQSPERRRRFEEIATAIAPWVSS